MLTLTELESRDTPATLVAGVFGSDYAAAYGFVGPVQDAFGNTAGTEWHAIAGLVGNGPRVVVFDYMTGATVADFFAFEPEFRGGVVLESVDVAGQSRLLVGAGPGGSPIVRQYDPVAGAEVGPVMVFGDLDVDRMGVDYISSSGRQVYAMMGDGSGPRLFAADAVTGQQTASVLVGPVDDRTGRYRPIPAGLGVRAPSGEVGTFGVYVDFDGDPTTTEWYALPGGST
jgi:hypothetical protein